MKKFDYLVWPKNQVVDLQVTLNELGRKGWELINSDSSDYYFKREIPEKYDYCESFDFQEMIAQGWEPISSFEEDKHFGPGVSVGSRKYLFRKEIPG